MLFIFCARKPIINIFAAKDGLADIKKPDSLGRPVLVLLRDAKSFRTNLNRQLPVYLTADHVPPAKLSATVAQFTTFQNAAM